jgi:glucose dehydrogenase
MDPAAVVYPEELYPLKGTPYGLERQALLSNLGAPCVKPPWGSLTAVDLVSGNV